MQNVCTKKAEKTERVGHRKEIGDMISWQSCNKC